MPQPPGAPACGHPPQAWPAGAGEGLEAAAPTAKADNCFSTRSPRHAGHTGVTPSRMRTSKRLPQSAHVYSKSGIPAVYRRAPGPSGP